MSIKDNFPNLRPSLSLDFANVKKLDSRVTFARASEGRYYDGVTTAKAEENLLLRSQEFDNSYWLKSAVTVSANATTAPDGTTTAETLTTTGTISAVYRGVLTLVSGAAYAGSVFFQAGTNNFAYLNISGGAGNYSTAVFDLSTGAVGQTTNAGTGGTVTATISNAGGGWYRCTIVATLGFSNASFALGFAPLASGNSFDTVGNPTGSTIGNTLSIWGAQLEQRSAVTAYTPTTTQPITNYIPVLQTASANVARFDHDPVTGESLGLLVEEQRTNLVLRSEEFDNAYWTKARSSIAANTVVAPDGTLTGDKVVEDTASGAHYVNRVFTGTAVSYTSSAYFKAAGRQFAYMTLYNGTTTVGSAYFNLSTGVVGTVSAGTASIQSVGNGWYRCSVTGTLAASANCQAVFYSTTSNNVVSYTGDGYSGIYIWGAQLEAGAFPTSYIKTEASQVTRSADSASMTGENFSSWYRADEGTIYTDSITYGGNGPIAYLTDNTSNNSHQINANFGGSNQFTAYVVTNGVNVVNFNSTPLTYGTNFKIGYGFKTNDFGASVNGASVSTDTSGTLPIVNRLDIGRRFDGSYVASAVIKKIAYYPLRLSNTNLQALTS